MAGASQWRSISRIELPLNSVRAALPAQDFAPAVKYETAPLDCSIGPDQRIAPARAALRGAMEGEDIGV